MLTMLLSERKIKFEFLNEKVLSYVFLWITIVLTIFSLIFLNYYPPICIDEPSFILRWLDYFKTGSLNEVFLGYPLVFEKSINFLGGMFVPLFGYNLFTIRIFPFIFFILSIIFIYLILKELDFKLYQCLLGCLLIGYLLIANGIVFLRGEIFVIGFSLIVLFFTL